MIKNYFLITLRSMMKNKLFISINIFGMAVAIALCIVGFFAYEYDASFDKVHTNGNSVYRVSAIREFQNSYRRHGLTPFPLGEVVRKTFTDVDQSSRFLESWTNLKREADVFHANLTYVDTEFFQMFTFDFIAGSATDLKDNASVFISEEMATRLFGNSTNALGGSIAQVIGTTVKELKIAGVFKDPAMNTSFYHKGGSAYMNMSTYKEELNWIEEDDWRSEGTLFVRINDPGRIKAVHDQLQPYAENNNRVRPEYHISEFVLDPFADMAHLDRGKSVQTRTWGAPSVAAVVGAMVMGLLILLIACFNLTNTSIAIASRRLKEIGIRKVMGSRRKHLIGQFLGETAIICLTALVFGLLLAEFLVGGWNRLWPEFQLSLHYLDNPGFVFFMLAILVFTGLLAGWYPALYVSRFEPVEILKGKLKFGGTNYFTRTLLVLQFAISLITIVSAVAFVQNARFQRDYDLGFDTRGCILTWVDSEEAFDAYRNVLQSNPRIRAMAGAKRGLAGIFGGRTRDVAKHESTQIDVDVIGIGDNYLNTMGITLVQGRDFNSNSETDQQSSVIITQGVASQFGWSDPIGKELMLRDSVKLYVVGVVKDVHNRGVWAEMRPMVLRYVTPRKYGQLVVSTRPEDTGAVNAFMAREWVKLFPNSIYDGHMFVEEMYLVNEMNMNIVYMFSFMGLIAMVLSATGLYSMVSLNIVRRLKEIGVRKVLGASTANLARIIQTEFVIILLVASLLGSWASYSLTNRLMANLWRYYQGVTLVTFVVSIAALFLISFVAIGYRVYATATMNPVDSLRDD